MSKRAKFTDRLMFNRIVCNADICKKLIRALIGLEVDDIIYINAEQAWEPGPGERGVRMDVVAKADGRMIDLEMQVAREANMGRRLRYYQAAMDTAELESGDLYEKLPESHIVFICLRDPFNLGRPVYTLDISCNEAPELDPKVGIRWHVLNAAAWEDVSDEDIRELLKYAKEGIPTGSLSREIDSLVDRYNDDRKWVSRVLTWEQDTKIQCRRAEERGIALGLEQGENRLATLIGLLLAENRVDDAARAADDRKVRNQLFEEFGL